MAFEYSMVAVWFSVLLVLPQVLYGTSPGSPCYSSCLPSFRLLKTSSYCLTAQACPSLDISRLLGSAKLLSCWILNIPSSVKIFWLISWGDCILRDVSLPVTASTSPFTSNAPCWRVGSLILIISFLTCSLPTKRSVKMPYVYDADICTSLSHHQHIQIIQFHHHSSEHTTIFTRLSDFLTSVSCSAVKLKNWIQHNRFSSWHFFLLPGFCLLGFCITWTRIFPDLNSA